MVLPNASDIIENNKSANALLNINKQLLQIKKQIQVSEGQKRAICEVNSNESERNKNEIMELKVEIIELNKRQQMYKDAIKDKIYNQTQCPKLPFKIKEVNEEAKSLLDQYTINIKKQIDMTQYHIDKRKTRLLDCLAKYNDLIQGNKKTEVLDIEKQSFKIARGLQINIQSIKNKIKEANHMKLNYEKIKSFLAKGSEIETHTLNKFKNQLYEQQTNLENLQKVMIEAKKMKTLAKMELNQKEFLTTTSAIEQSNQTSMNKKLLNFKKSRIQHFEEILLCKQNSENKNERIENDDQFDTEDNELTENNVRPSHAKNHQTDIINALIMITKAKNSKEVLSRFETQIETYNKLLYVQSISENEKLHAENQYNLLTSQMKHYSHNKHVASHERLLSPNNQLTEQTSNQNLQGNELEIQRIKDTLESISQAVHSLILPFIREAMNDTNTLTVLHSLEKMLATANIQEVHIIEEKQSIQQEEKWLPIGYSTLAKGKVTQQISSSTLESEEEEEVPSRNFLKTQANLISDTKAKRLNVHV